MRVPQLTEHSHRGTGLAATTTGTPSLQLAIRCSLSRFRVSAESGLLGASTAHYLLFIATEGGDRRHALEPYQPPRGTGAFALTSSQNLTPEPGAQALGF